MNALLLLGGCLLLGVFAKRFLAIPDNAPQVLGYWVLNLAFPCLVLAKVPQMALDATLFYAAFATWGTFLGALGLFWLLGRWLGWDKGTVGALTLTCGLGNTAFMGLAMIESLRGPEALGAALIADQLGSFIALSTGGIMVAAACGGGVVTAPEIAKRVFTFPPLLALMAGFGVRALGGWPEAVTEVLLRIGNTLVPLALFSVGLQLSFGRPEAGQTQPLLLGLGWKLFLAPLLVMATGLLLGVRGLAYPVGVLQAAMAPMITAGILADTWKLAPGLPQRVVGFGIIASLATVPLWNWLLG